MSKAESVDLGEGALQEARARTAERIAKKPGERYAFRGNYRTKKRRLAELAGDVKNSRESGKIENQNQEKTQRDFTKKPLNFKYITKNVVNSLDDHYSVKYNSAEITTDEAELQELCENVSESVNEILEILKFTVSPIWFVIIQLVLNIGSFAVKKWFQIAKAAAKFKNGITGDKKGGDADSKKAA